MSDAKGRYVIGEEIGAGGMATVHLGGMLGDAGFARTVAIKRLHPQLAKDPDLASMLLEEGRLSARVTHVNVVQTLDVVARDGELFIVMEHVHGEPLSRLLRNVARAGGRVPARVAAGIVAGALRGLHAAHEATDALGRSLSVVHRDVSPQNIMVGVDGVPRVLDFGIAKAAGRAHTETGQIKGKMAYMPIEQLHGDVLDRRADIYSAGVVLWEALVGERLFTGSDHRPNLEKLLHPDIDPPSARAPEIGALYDGITMRALALDREDRFPTALAMAEALESVEVATAAEIGAWVRGIAGDEIADRAARIAAIERDLAARVRDSRARLAARDEPIVEAKDLAPEAPAPPVPAPSGGRSRALVLGGAVIAVAAALALISGARPAPKVPLADSASPPATTAPAAPAAPTVASATSPLAPAEPASSASASAPPPRASSPSRPARARPADTSCSPPYTIDADGHKHYKRACLR